MKDEKEGSVTLAHDGTKKSVVLGLRNETHTEIVSGLDEKVGVKRRDFYSKNNSSRGGM